MPLESLSYTGVNTEDLKDGDTFDKIGDHEICKKYMVRQPKEFRGKQQEKRFTRVDQKHFPLHVDTAQYFRNDRNIPDDALCIVTAKLHGTSWRGSHTYVSRGLTLRDRIAKMLGAQVVEMEHDYIAGSRKVNKDPRNPAYRDAAHFYGSDIHSGYLKNVEGALPKGYVVFGELVGWTPEGSAIQKGYTYGFERGESRLYVYRVAVVNEDGHILDLSWDQVKQFCDDRGFNYVQELWRGPKKDFKPEMFLEKALKPDFPQCLPLSDEGTVDEGVVIRWEKLVPEFYKCKSQAFYEFETAMLDSGEEDIESQESPDA